MPPWQSEERWQSDETASVATSKGVSDVTGVELGSVMSGDAHQVLMTCAFSCIDSRLNH